MQLAAKRAAAFHSGLEGPDEAGLPMARMHGKAMGSPQTKMVLQSRSTKTRGRPMVKHGCVDDEDGWRHGDNRGDDNHGFTIHQATDPQDRWGRHGPHTAPHACGNLLHTFALMKPL